VLLVLAGLSFPAFPSDFPKRKFTDPRDGQVYPTVQIDGLEWFAKNLNHAYPGSFCYDDDENNCAKLGRLYRWEDALAACPVGWHLSTDYEWQKLEISLGMPFGDLETINARGSDQGDQLAQGGKTGFNYTLPGYRDPAGVYKSMGTGLALWHANEADYATAWHRDLRPTRSGIYRSRVNKEYALTVRCVKNSFDTDYETWEH
jgi:uncharacterized protein (TIGR02145 family)